MKTIHTFLAVVLCCVLSVRADHYVAQGGQQPSGNFISWSTAASNIQDAVNAATNGATVWVGAGRYTLPPNATNFVGPNVVYINRPLTLCASNGAPERPIIDGEGVNRGIAVNSLANSQNSFILDGLTISNCYAQSRGGGIYFVTNGTMKCTLRNCLIVTNTVDWGEESKGGGLYVYYAPNLLLTNCVFRENRALGPEAGNPSAGGGVYIRGSAQNSPLSLTDCVFRNNTAMTGGGVCLNRTLGSAALDARRCVFDGNHAIRGLGSLYTAQGGGVSLESAAALKFYDCLMYGNTASYRGGGIYVSVGYVETHNCTIVNNVCGTQQNYIGGGIHERLYATLSMYNTIIYSNSPNNYYDEDRPLEISYSCTYPADDYTQAGEGNITNNPQFVNMAVNDFHLRSTSPCNNTGTNQTWMIGAGDLDGNARIDKLYRQVDMGCYEYLFEGSVLMIR